MRRKLLVVALGGNAILQKDEKGTVEEQWRNVYRAAEQIVSLIEAGYRVVVTHGNGPQVGNVMEWMDALKEKIPPLTMDIAGAMTQGWIGYMLQQAIRNVLIDRGLADSYGVVAIVNQVQVRSDDPAWKNPTKYIGPYYSEDEAKGLAQEKGWTFKPDPRGGWRRVVPSPDVVTNVEIEAIRALVERGFVVITSGGGGIPVVADERGRLRGVEAVIDKDIAGQMLARLLGTDHFMILTDVEGAYLNYGKPNQQLLRVLTVSEARRLLREGVFGAGSMGPKVEACARFVEATGREAYIGHLYKALETLRGEAGTRFIPG